MGNEENLNQDIKMIHEFLEYCDSVEIAVLRSVGRVDEKMLPPQVWRTNANSNLLPWARFENINNDANILIRPNPNIPHPWLFLDDLPYLKANALHDKYQCLVLETSIKNFQCRLLANRNLNTDERTTVQRALVQLLGSDADSGSIAGDKFGRLAGYRNKKIGKDFKTNLAGVPNQLLPKIDPSPYLSSSPPLVGGCASSGFNKSGIDTKGTNQSGNDFGYVIGRLRFLKKSGLDYFIEAKKLEAELIESCRSRKSNPGDYARRTIKSALDSI